MNIKEATEKAMKENGFIRRKDHAFKGILIKPTNIRLLYFVTWK